MEFNDVQNYYQNELNPEQEEEENRRSLDHFEDIKNQIHLYDESEVRDHSHHEELKNLEEHEIEDIGKYLTENKVLSYPQNSRTQIAFLTEGHQNHYIRHQSSIITNKFETTFEQDQNKQESSGLFKLREKRPSEIIKYSNEIKMKYIKAKNGHKSETTELNINIKTMTKNLLANKMRMKFFSSLQEKLIRDYCGSNANFETTQKLFGVQKSDLLDTEIAKQKSIKKQYRSKADSKILITVSKDSDKIRRVCYKQYSSSKFVVDTFKSDKMAFKNKLILLKFLQSIRFSAIFPENLKKWKNNKTQKLMIL